MDQGGRPNSSRPSSSTEGVPQTVTMIRHPPYVASSSSSSAPVQGDVQHESSRPCTRAPQINYQHRPPHNVSSSQQIPPTVAMQQAAPRHANTHNRPAQRTHEVDGQLVLTRLNEFADFLIRFNNCTAPAIDTRIHRIESMVAEHLNRTDKVYREHEKRVNERVDNLSRTVRAACAFSDEDNQERDATLAKNVSEAVISALAPRFDNITRRVDEHETITRALQTSIRSFEARLKKIENRALGISPASSPACSNAPPVTTNADVSTSSSIDADEIRYELDRLCKQVEGARKEAHLDKEALSLLYSDKHQELTLTFHNDIRALKNAVGVGKGGFRSFKDSSASSIISLAERLDTLAMDLQDAVEHLKDAAVSRDDQISTELKGIVELLTRHADTSLNTRKVFHDAAVMADIDGEAVAMDSGITEANTDHLGDPPTPLRDSRLGPANVTESPVSAPETCPVLNVNVATTSSPAALLTSEPSSETTGANLVPVSDWTATLPHQTPPPTSSTGHLIVDASMNDAREAPSVPTSEQSEQEPCTQASLAPRTTLISPPPSSPPEATEQVERPSSTQSPTDARSTLISPPLTSSPSSRSTSPSVNVKRKPDMVDNADVHERASEDIQPASTDPNLVPPVDNGDDDYIFDDDRPMSPFTPAVDRSIIDLERSPSPLTSLSSDEEDQSDRGDNSDASEEESEEEPLAIAVRKRRLSTPSRRLATSVNRKNDEKTGGFRCPKQCGKSYTLKDSLSRHLKLGCPRGRTLVRRASSTLSERDAKRRKVTKGSRRPSTPKGTPGGKKRGIPRKALEKLITHVHPPDVLQKADWPPKSMVNEMFDHQLLQCDRCDTSYHYRCVGVKKGDPRLVPDAPFICPPCTYINDPQAVVSKHNGSCCGRPDCDWPGEACDDDEDYFVVEKVLGRRLHNVNGPPDGIYRWLVKWSGYPISECDWLEESGLPEADKLISRYYAAAAAEGMFPRDDGKIYLLREAHSKLHEALQKKWKWTVNWT